MEREREREREREVSDYYYHSDSKCATITSTLIVHVKSLLMILHVNQSRAWLIEKAKP